MIRKIKFKNYKAFTNLEEMELRPVTLVIGKNSSGKSSILKLIALIDYMVNNNFWIPSLKVRDIVLGGRYQDLFHNSSTSDFEFEVEFEGSMSIRVNYYIENSFLKIYSFSCFQNGNLIQQVKRASREENLEKLLSSIIKKERGRIEGTSNYIGPIRCLAPASIRFHGISRTSSIEYDGSGTYNILLNSYIYGDGIFDKVSSWMDKNLEGQRLVFSNAANNSGNYTLWVKRKGVEVNIAEVGQGVAQVLPIVTLAACAECGTVNIVEQPELHLHPAAHANVAELIGLSAVYHHNVFVVESHSKNMLLGFQKMIVNKNVAFTPDDIAIYFVDETSEGSTLKRINLDKNGEFDDWPIGVFSESFELVKEINKYVYDSNNR